MAEENRLFFPDRGLVAKGLPDTGLVPKNLFLLEITVQRAPVLVESKGLFVQGIGQEVFQESRETPHGVGFFLGGDPRIDMTVLDKILAEPVAGVVDQDIVPFLVDGQENIHHLGIDPGSGLLPVETVQFLLAETTADARYRWSLLLFLFLLTGCHLWGSHHYQKKAPERSF